MPYRRLPNTDEARLRALNQAYKLGKELAPFELTYSQSTFSQVQSFLPYFDKIIREHRFNYSTQIKRGKEYQQLLKKVKVYISHFIQVMNMAVQRGELPVTTRTYYGMKENENHLPTLSTENEILEWGERLIKGEAERTKKGLTPITNPTIGKMKVWYDNFITAYHSHKTSKKTNSRYVGEMNDLRKTADEIIIKVWNEVEITYSKLPEVERRQKATTYGIVYVYRKNEISRLKMPDAIQAS